MNIFKRIYCRVYQLGFRIAMPLLPYRDPEILTSVGALAVRLSELGKKHVLVITDRDIAVLGMTDPLKKALEKQGIAVTLYGRTVPNPTFENIEEAAALYRKEGCDTLVGFGGGSSMDCAKAVGARAANPRKTVRQLMGIFHVHCRIPLLVAIPTTAGTGSEVTLAAVLTDTERGIKSPMYDFSLIPAIAVHDWTLTEHLPKSLTATTGIDALTHAVEAYIGRCTSRYTRKKIEECVTLIHTYLYRACQNGSDREARQAMLTAAYCGGIALTQSYVGYVHGLAHALGGLYGTPHGLANSIILPHFLKAYGRSAEKKLAKLARLIDLAEPEDPDGLASARFIAWVEEMNRLMNIPVTLDGIDPKDFPFMAARADREANPLYPVPMLMDRDALEHMYRVVCTPLPEA